ncbi:hypothetical protein BX661DRAFT_191909 [Kickxella alabastrina]|uniref:uncharacterized protein n=1 Tax=Kickxella alabastrina TaxID=61397 RepID=UPI00222092C2|nr:uncharacterized protein BX661DRAFT_191909 [Kickxella alabastrina]KAI7818191.1 hypothetical protein BX661DRAFT_191909 [Kickxella alabastrina]
MLACTMFLVSRVTNATLIVWSLSTWWRMRSKLARLRCSTCRSSIACKSGVDSIDDAMAAGEISGSGGKMPLK